MRWLADECIDAGLVRGLRQAGHDVVYAAEMAPGASDPDVLSYALAEQRLLLTEDKDFGDLIFRSRNAVPGLVLLRFDPTEPALKWTRLEAAMAHFGESLFGRYVVIDSVRFRARPLPPRT